MKQVTILGAGYAGMLAALRLQKRAQVTLISRDGVFVERIRLHQAAAGQTLPARPITDMLRGTGITFIQATVKHIAPNAHTLTLSDTNSATSEHHYQTLIYALGSFVDRASVQGVREHAHTLDPRGFDAIRPIGLKGGKITIVGGGLTGIEAATELAEAYPNAHVNLITCDVIGEGLSEGGRDYIRRAFERLNIASVEHTTVQRIEAGKLFTDGGTFEADGILWAASMAVPSLARESGIAVNARGQILVDASLRSISHPDIIAAGDSACVPGIRMACASAMPMGAHAAEVAAGSKAPFRFRFDAQCISLGRHDAVLQFVNADDSPGKRFLSGRSAVFMKEMICRYTVGMIKLERRFPGSYMWRKADLGLESVQNTFARAEGTA